MKKPVLPAILTALLVLAVTACERHDGSTAPAQSPSTPPASPDAVAAPSPESVKRLLAALGLEKNLTNLHSHLDNQVKNWIASATRGVIPSKEDKAALDAWHDKVFGEAKETLSWVSMQEMYVEIYTQNFTQADIDDLIAFYESPTGKVWATKQVSVGQQAQMSMSKRIGPVLQRAQMLAIRGAADIVSKYRAMQIEPDGRPKAPNPAGTHPLSATPPAQAPAPAPTPAPAPANN
jgi:hypothetical protein